MVLIEKIQNEISSWGEWVTGARNDFENLRISSKGPDHDVAHITSFRCSLMAGKSNFDSFKKCVEGICSEIPEAKQYPNVLNSVDIKIATLVNDVDKHLDTERKLNALIGGATSLIKTCNSLFSDAVENPLFKRLLKQNVESISQMIEEIDDVFESSPDTEAAFSPAVKEVVSEFDKLQIELLENSVLDSTDASVEKSVIMSDENRQFMEEIVNSQEQNGRLTEDMAENMAEKTKESNIDDWQRSESRSSCVVEVELPSCGLASDRIESDNINERIESDLNQLVQANPPVQETVTEICVDVCEAAYDFGLLEGIRDGSRELDIKKRIVNTQGKEADPERKGNGESLTLADDTVSVAFNEISRATCIEDRNYIEEFSQKIQSLDVLIEKESQKNMYKWSSKEASTDFFTTKREGKRIRRPKFICVLHDVRIKWGLFIGSR